MWDGARPGAVPGIPQMAGMKATQTARGPELRGSIRPFYGIQFLYLFFTGIRFGR
jgi:hypothetical protein